MTKFLAGVLSVIAVGVLLIAYGLLNPAVPAYADQARFARPACGYWFVRHEITTTRLQPTKFAPEVLSVNGPISA